MENTLTTTTAAELTPEYAKAFQIDKRIKANIGLINNAIYDIGMDLKEMMEEKLYQQLGYETFEEYTQQAHGFKSRQAYKYIKVATETPNRILQSNADLGITKLELLLQVPDIEKEEFIEENDLAGMTVDQIKQLIEEHNNQGEQISLLQGEKEELQKQLDTQDDVEHIKDENSQLRKELDKLKNTPIETVIKEPSAEDIAKIKEKVKKEYDKQLEKAVADAVEETKKQTDERLLLLESDKQQALERAEQLEKELNIHSDNTTLQFTLLFNNFQEGYGKIISFIEETEEEKAVKYKTALCAALSQLLDSAKEM